MSSAGSPLSLGSLGDNWLGESLLDKLQEAHQDLFGHSYATSEDLDSHRINAFAHLLSRGHEGRVLCISASNTVDFIVSGGEDHTMRIWEYDASRTVYEFEIDGQKWTGVVTKEADVSAEAQENSGDAEMTHQLEIYPLMENGRRARGSKQFIWVRFDGDTLSDTCGHTDIPFTTTVTHQATDSYKLSSVLLHDEELQQNQPLIDSAREAGSPESVDPETCAASAQRIGVTAVACAGMVGPFISGTSNGSLHFLRLPKAGGNVMSLRDLGIGAINDLDVLEVDDRADAKFVGPWILAVAGQAGRARVIQLSMPGRLQWVEVCEPLEHEGPVLKVRQVRDAGAFGVRLATCAGQGIYLWNVEGMQLTRLELPEVSQVVDLTVTNRDSGTLLFAGQGGKIGVWVVDPASNELPSEPLTVYRYKGSGIDVDQGSDLAEYAVNIRDPNVIVTWELLAARPECLISPESLSKWWELLIRPGKEKFTTEMRHQAPVTDFKVAEDDVEGPVLLSATKDGTVYTWSMKSTDRGEICAQLRSLSLMEIILPPGLLLMTVFQLCSFAFGPSTTWRSSVKETVRFGEKIAFFGTELSLEFDITQSDKFWWEILFVYRLMLFFVIFEVMGAQEILTWAQGWVQSSPRFKQAELEGQLGSMHVLRRLFGLMQTLLSLMTWFCCTVGVAPAFKIVAQAMRCSRDQDSGRYYLDVTGGTSVECGMLFNVVPISLTWEGYGTWSFSPFMIFLLAVVYLLGLAPYAVVGGDSSYVQRDEIVDRQAWAFNAERKATALNLGIFHPNPRHVFKSQLMEMISKALLPMITWLVSHPFLQMSLSSALMGLLYAESMLFPAFIDRTYSAIVQGSRLFAFCTMLCGLITVVIGEKFSVVPVLLLFLSLVCVGALTVYRTSQQQAWRRTVFRRSTSMSNDAELM